MQNKQGGTTMDQKVSPKPKLIYTPKHHIPIGEVVLEDDVFALKIKKHGEQATETITIDTLISLIYQSIKRS